MKAKRIVLVLLPVVVCAVAITLALAQQGCVTPTPTPVRRGLIPMVEIPAGRFLMGTLAGEPGHQDGEGPQHWVTISKPFLMGKTEVTQGQWRTVMGSNPSHFSSCGGDCPVEQVTWLDAIEFCNRLSDREGLSRCYRGVYPNITWDRNCTSYRLPTEAEWEYAARAGSTTAFASGSIIRELRCGHDPNLDLMGWYCHNSGDRTHPVAQKQANAWGLFDMHGNVWEWVWDWYGNYPSSSVADPVGPSSGSTWVFRGGSWYYFAFFCQSAVRFANHGFPGSDLGFRLSRSL